MILLYTGLQAQEASSAPVETEPQSESEVQTLDVVTVVGKAEDIPRIAGSAALVTKEAIRNQDYSNPARVLQQVPGVYIREEDGFGNFPNISIRGADPGRSSKVTIMEDGIPMAPAPYSAPAAYYSPRIGRMSGVEVLKGSSQVRYGPHTTGGVVNYLSTPFTELGLEGNSAEDFYLKSSFGSFNTWKNHTYWGQTVQFDAGLLGYVLEFNHEHSDGFRTIQGSDGNTGYEVYEPMLKVFFEPDSSIRQRIEFRIGYTDFKGLETYVGLSERDFARDPYSRYAATQFDVMNSEQFRTSLTYIIEPTDALRFETSVYYNSFQRAWYKLQDVIVGVDTFDPSQAIGAGSGAAYDLINGNGAGSWRVRNNNREYNTVGIQTRMDWDFATGPLQHSLSLGARLHYDDEIRFQNDDLYTLDASGNIIGVTRGAPGSQDDRRSTTTALALYIEDSIQFGKLTVKPGLRYEHLWQDFDNFRSGAAGEGELTTWAPGIGAVYQATESISIFGSYYRGVSTPGPSGTISDGQKAEYADSFELGARYYTPKMQAELIGFYSKHKDLIVPDLVGASGATETTNAGDIEVYGLEAAIRYDPLAESATDWHLPMRAALTLTHAELTSDTPSTDEESIFSGGTAGNRVPYIPEYNITFGLGVEYKKLGVYLDATYTPETFGTASNTTSGLAPDGTPDGRFGTADAAFLVDLNVKYRVTDNVRLFAGVSNLLGEEYVASRLPYGPRAGAPRMWYGGVELKF
ncbi:TonB-dependent receptor family protein [Prosthecobacter fusiformis]|nr:TonB-dependent receptor [Prosthecobacter fusiformis]